VCLFCEYDHFNVNPVSNDKVDARHWKVVIFVIFLGQEVLSSPKNKYNKFTKRVPQKRRVYIINTTIDALLLEFIKNTVDSYFKLVAITYLSVNKGLSILILFIVFLLFSGGKIQI
jgi:hypothetical protein